ncbi:hypothetical protein [Nocardia phage KYD2]|nr:hypothetical protein [Nocardia phage KYD2]
MADIAIDVQDNARGPWKLVPGAIYREGFFYAEGDDHATAADRIKAKLEGLFPKDRFRTRAL